jgi:hypothetical protein
LQAFYCELFKKVVVMDQELMSVTDEEIGEHLPNITITVPKDRPFDSSTLLSNNFDLPCDTPKLGREPVCDAPKMAADLPFDVISLISNDSLVTAASNRRFSLSGVSGISKKASGHVLDHRMVISFC